MSQVGRPSSRAKRARRATRSQEGAVMLVVMLILLTATVMAAASLQATQYELRASGYNRAAVQTEYVSEAAAVTTLAWVDAICMDRGFLTQLATWAAAPPDMLPFAEPRISALSPQNANRTQWRQQAELTQVVMPPITQPGSSVGTPDPVGTLGPRSPYIAGIEDKNNPGGTDYVVDLYDCRRLPNSAIAGSQVNQTGSGQLHEVQYYCVVTSHGRTYVPGAPTKKWRMNAGDYIANRFTMAHDSRGTIVTPAIIL